MADVTTQLRDELRDVDARLATSSPREVVEWATTRFAGRFALACSFEDVALLDIVREIAPSTPILFLDTGGHFPETLQFARRLEEEWELNLVRITPGPEATDRPCGTEGCCQVRKVVPLRRELERYDAWMTSVKRVDAPSRAETKVVDWDPVFGLVKVNPLAAWTDEDVSYYLGSRGLPEHPLWAEGYASIGCAAMTIRPTDPFNRRSGRWAGLDKNECGLHEG